MLAAQKLETEIRQFFESPLNQLANQLTTDMSCVNTLILERLNSQIRLIPEVAQYLISAGGKRIRPLLTLASANLFGYEEKDHIKLATAVEFIHTATLLHDDVVDESDLRRGRPSANMVWGNAPSILVGDFLFSRAFQLMVETHSLSALDVLSNTSAIISEGEVQQLLMLNDLTTTQDIYMKIIESKTAHLFKAACEVGAIISKTSKEEIRDLSLYGLNLGILFQLADDVIDYRESQTDIGKNRGDDFKEGKVTLPVILSYESADKSEKDFWTRCIERSDIKEGDFEQALTFLDDHDIYSRISDIAEIYAQRALEALKNLPDCSTRELLKDIIGQVKQTISV